MFKNAIKFIRVKILLTCFLIVLLGSVSVDSVTLQTFFAIFVLIAWYVHGSTSNDYADREIDKVNLRGAKDRPLVTDTLSHRSLWTIHTIAGLLALLLAMFFGIMAFIFMAIILALDYAYSFKPFRIKDRGALAQLMLPIAYVVYPFSLGYWSAQSEAPFPWLLVAGLYLGFIARLFIKDFRDIKGDKKFGKRTFLIRHGTVKTCIASGVFSSVALLVLCWAVQFSAGVVVALVIGQAIVLILLLKLSKSTGMNAQLKIVARLAQIGNVSVFAVLLYYLSLQYISSPYASLALPLLIGLMLAMILLKEARNDLKTKST